MAFSRPPGVDEGAAGAPGFLDFPGSPRDGREDATPAGAGPAGSGADDGMSFLIGGDDFPGAAGDPGSGGGDIDGGGSVCSRGLGEAVLRVLPRPGADVPRLLAAI